MVKKGNIMVKPNFLEKLSFKLAKWIGSPLSLYLHTLVFGGFFILRYLGFVNNTILIFLTSAVCLEAIYLVIFIQMIVKNNTQNLSLVQSSVEEIKQEEKEVHKLMVNILHLAHQMKTIQQEIDILRKSRILKSAGNGHRIHA